MGFGTTFECPIVIMPFSNKLASAFVTSTNFGHLLLIIVTVLGLSESSFGQHLCSSLFGTEDGRLKTISAQLSEELLNPLMLDSLKIDSDEVTGLDYISFGTSGHVYKVSFRGKEYALKIFTGNGLNPRVQTDAIAIQKALGNLNLAPKVIGTFDKDEINKWYSRYRALGLKKVTLLENGYFGLLMELINEKRTFKEGKEKTKVSKVTKENLIRQAHHISNLIDLLKIKPFDYDGVITDDGNLKLIDISFYSYEENPAYRQIDRFLKYLENMIDEKTEVVDQ